MLQVRRLRRSCRCARGAQAFADKPSLANFLPENLASVLKDIITAGKYTHVVGATTSAIKSVIPRMAVSVNVSPITDVIAIKVLHPASSSPASSRCPGLVKGVPRAVQVSHTKSV